MKPSTTFARWIKANSERIAADSSDEFKSLVVTVSTVLDMLDASPKGVAGVTAEYVAETLARLKAELDRRDMEAPDIRLPKIKVVRPRG